MRKDQFESVVTWQKETFPSASTLSKIAHLKQEVDELAADVENGSDARLEFADCVLLLFGAAKAWGLDYEDICQAIDDKMEINKARKWGQPDKDGVVNHIK